ncbi:MAG TPA: HAMP domain-containing sensor histidine kinase [Anaeromyxobacteraceae bacterium]|nr:HAMP domain-containing sensor histidine kinase [Anaeromyxobacteraceae bacterium]
MFARTKSLRGKIRAGFVLSFSFLLLVASVMFVNLHLLEDQVALHSGISRFLDTTLEMRRYEKNYLLYGKEEDLERAMDYAGSAADLVAEGAMGGPGGGAGHPRWARFLLGIDPGTDQPEYGSEQTARLLRDYRALLRKAAEGGARAGARGDPEAETSIRDLGRRITGIAERLSSIEGRNLQEILRSGRRALVLLVVLFLAGTAVIARVIALTAIRPLKELETGMQRIAAGDYHTLPEEAVSDEIGSMNAAFNRMIREVFEHRQEILQSERLAALGTALAGIAHEINNPLSNISTSAEILKEENEKARPGERRELIDQIIAQTDRATDIIRAVLDFSREAPLDRRSTNLLSAVRGSLILVRGEMPAHVSVEVDVAPDIEIRADKTKLEQAFINLLTNAIDAMRDSGRERRITVSARPAGERHVEIAFRDTGRGIPRHQLDRIFDPFFTTKGVGEGTGLGLYVTHQIVEQHGGTVRVDSVDGEGTTVVITLPRREPEPPEPGGSGRRGGGRPGHG